ncbi:MAG: ABC transporter ATP-binding protein [Spirochaetales bacterium]|jgi:predicted ABC-type transport system involved in lysophospholipase L1 biosynthesis ATPase subunit|nr:ABC transporter ATP-binding protein [Spirochaetales bacterium]
MANSFECVHLSSITKSFPATQAGDSRLMILEGISLTIRHGQSVAIVGKSGSGKSTLLEIAAGLLEPDSGTVMLDGVCLHGLDDRQKAILRARKMGFIFQASYMLADFTALENVKIAALIAGSSPREATTRATDLLHRVGLGERLSHTSDRLSGGERQRVVIARSLVNDPAIIFADEPTGNLDEENAAIIEDLLLGLVKERNATLMLVTHNPQFASRLDRVLTLSERTLVEGM